jgi:hypothetical protein
MLLKLTEAEIAELRGKRFASSSSASESSVTTIVDVRLRDGRQRVVHEYKGKLIKTPLSVFLLRFPWRVN